MLADNWDKGSLYSYRAFSFPSDMPYETITQPVLFITGERDQPLTGGAKKARFCVLLALLTPTVLFRWRTQRAHSSDSLKRVQSACLLTAAIVSVGCQGTQVQKAQQHSYYHKLHSCLPWFCVLQSATAGYAYACMQSGLQRPLSQFPERCALSLSSCKA